MTFIEIAKQHLKELEREKAHFQKSIKNTPPGFLSCYQNGNYTKWYYLSSLTGPRTRKYLPKSERKRAASLAGKTIASIHLKLVSKQITLLKQFIESYSKSLPGTSLINQIARLSEITDKPVPTLPEWLLKWQNEPFPSSPPFPEKRTIRSAAGLMVRSKAEDLIATELTRRGIPFHYEETVTVGNQAFHPDFVILHPVSGKRIIWEHFGKMDDQSYAEKAIRKIQQYLDAGYIPGVNLIITTETSETMLSSTMVDAIIASYFGMTDLS